MTMCEQCLTDTADILAKAALQIAEIREHAAQQVDQARNIATWLEQENAQLAGRLKNATR